MEDVAVAIQCGTLRRLDDAMQDFFRRTKAGLGGFPRFKGRRHWNSISIISGVRIRGNALHVPRYGQMTVRRRGGSPDGVPRSATLKRESGKWYAVVAVATPAPVHDDKGHVTGIDMNARVAKTGPHDVLPEVSIEEERRKLRRQLQARTG